MLLSPSFAGGRNIALPALDDLSTDFFAVRHLTSKYYLKDHLKLEDEAVSSVTTTEYDTLFLNYTNPLAYRNIFKQNHYLCTIVSLNYQKV